MTLIGHSHEPVLYNFLSPNIYRDVPHSPVVRILPSNAGMQVQSLVGDIRSHYLAAKKPTHETEAML